MGSRPESRYDESLAGLPLSISAKTLPSVVQNSPLIKCLLLIENAVTQAKLVHDAEPGLVHLRDVDLVGKLSLDVNKVVLLGIQVEDLDRLSLPSVMVERSLDLLEQLPLLSDPSHLANVVSEDIESLAEEVISSLFNSSLCLVDIVEPLNESNFPPNGFDLPDAVAF